MPDLKPAYVFGPWITPSDRPDFAYRAAPREDDRAEVWLHRPDDGTLPYWCGCWGGMTDAVELRDAHSIDAAQRALDQRITLSGHWLAETLDRLVTGLPEMISGLLAELPGLIDGALKVLRDTCATLPSCGDCPVGGREGSGPVCPRATLCDLECAEQVRAMAEEEVSASPPGVPVDTSVLLLNPEDEALVDAMAADRMKGWTSRSLRVAPPPPKPHRGGLSFWIAYASGFLLSAAYGQTVLGSALTLLVTIPCCEAVWWIWRRASLVTTIVASMSQTADSLRWQGSRARMWLALFLLGRVANLHGQSVELSDKAGETP